MTDEELIEKALDLLDEIALAEDNKLQPINVATVRKRWRQPIAPKPPEVVPQKNYKDALYITALIIIALGMGLNAWL